MSSQLPPNIQAAEGPPLPKEGGSSTRSMAAPDVEDGELDEAVFEDLYEPYEEPVDAPGTEQSSQEPQMDDDDIYVPPEPSKFGFAGDDNEPRSRERSRSYSPYLSPSDPYGASSAEGPEARTPIHGTLALQCPVFIHLSTLTYLHRRFHHDHSPTWTYVSFPKYCIIAATTRVGLGPAQPRRCQEEGPVIYTSTLAARCPLPRLHRRRD